MGETRADNGPADPLAASSVPDEPSTLPGVPDQYAYKERLPQSFPHGLPASSLEPVWTSSIHLRNCFLTHQWEQIRCCSWRPLYRQWHILEMQQGTYRSWWENWQPACGERPQIKSAISRNNIFLPARRSRCQLCQRRREMPHTTPVRNVLSADREN